MSKLCIIYNTAPRYREAIFRAIDEEYDCDWYFGETKTDIKEMDVSLLKNVSYYKTIGNRTKLFWQCGMLKCLFSRKYDRYLYLAETRSLATWVFVVLAHYLFPKKKIYSWSHGFYGKESKLQLKLESWRYNLQNGAFVYGNYARNLMIENGICAEKLYTIHNSLHYSEQLELRKKMTPTGIYKEHFGSDAPIIVFIGRLTKVKQLNLLLLALDLLNKKGERYNLVFVGDGSERKMLEEIVIEKRLEEQVWFYGACYDEATNASLIFNADLCVAPGNVGLTAMHTMVFGTPVISHNDFKWQMPEFEAIKPGETGDFFERENVNSLADAISRWFTDKSDKRDEVREACYKEIDTQWTPEFQMRVISSVICK